MKNRIPFLLLLVCLIYSCSQTPKRHVTELQYQQRLEQLLSQVDSNLSKIAIADSIQKKKLLFIFLSTSFSSSGKLSDSLKTMGYDLSSSGTTPHNKFQGLEIDPNYRKEHHVKDYINVNYPIMTWEVLLHSDTVKSYIKDMAAIGFHFDCDIYTWGFVGEEETDLLIF